MTNSYKIRSLIIATLTLASHTIWGQVFDKSQAHPSIKWQQINSPQFRLIFPDTFAGAAKKLVDSLSAAASVSGRDLGVQPKKITFILQGNHIDQNGYVQLAPRKSELYPVPSSTPSNNEWLPNLALHEYRHVAQFDKLTGSMRAPFFDQLALALFGLNLPAWYFEGDATQIETLHSAGGRGRLPSWEMPIRANLGSGKSYNFNKYVLGSFKDNVPSYYTIGYLMNDHLTRHYGAGSHGLLLEDMRGKLIRPYNFQRALRKISGLNSNQLFQETIAELSDKWSKEKAIHSAKTDTLFTGNHSYPTDYLLPQYDDKNALYALRLSRQETPTIVKLDAQTGEKNIVKTGGQISPHYHIRGEEIIWDEYRKDPRFGKQTYNVINIYNLNTGELKTLTHKSRYYSPTLHPHLNKAIAVEVDLANLSYLIEIDTKTGAILRRQAAPAGLHLQQPRYDEAGNQVVAIAVSDLGTNLIRYDLANLGSPTLLLNWGNQELERPFFHEGNVIYKAHYDGIDNIYSLDEGQIQQLTAAEYGAFNPYIDAKGALLYNDYRHDGNIILRKEASSVGTSAVKNVLSKATLASLALVDNAASEHSASADSIAITAYKPGAHLFQFHSLSISSNDFESFDDYKPGVFWLSNDLLNTTEAKIGYEYDTDLNKGSYSAELSYRKYLPVFSLRYANRGRIGQAVNNSTKKELVPFDYRDHFASFEVSIPLSVYRQNTVYSYGVNFATSYTKRYDMSVNLKNFNEVIAFPLSYQAYINRNSRRAQMDLLPKWGQNLSVTYRHLPFENQMGGDILSLRSNFYFPGLFKNHGIQVRFAMQRGTDTYLGSYDIPLPTGWGHYKSPIVKNTGMIDYRLPIAYPDWSLGSVAFIKRLQGLLFTDFQNMHKSLAPQTMGIGLSADFNAFRYPLPDISVGTKLTYINSSMADKRFVPSFTLSYTY